MGVGRSIGLATPQSTMVFPTNPVPRVVPACCPSEHLCVRAGVFGVAAPDSCRNRQKVGQSQPKLARTISDLAEICRHHPKLGRSSPKIGRSRDWFTWAPLQTFPWNEPERFGAEHS